MKKMFVFILLTFFATSCESEFEIDNFNFDKKLVVLSTFSPGVYWKVDVSQSFSIFNEDEDGNDRIIKDATVTISEYDNERLVSRYDLLFNGEFYTHSVLVPKESHRYEIVVKKDGFKTVKATSLCPRLIKISEKEFTESFDDGVYSFEVDVDIEINNEFTSSDIFTMAVSVDPLGQVDHIDKLNNIFLKTADESFDDFDVFPDSFNSTVNLSWNSTVDLDTSVLTLVNDYNTYSGIYIGEQDGEGRDTDNRDDININPKKYQTIIYVLGLSNEYFQYGTALRRYVRAKGGPLTKEDRPNLYSNIENGYGLFGAISIGLFVE